MVDAAIDRTDGTLATDATAPSDVESCGWSSIRERRPIKLSIRVRLTQVP